MAHGCRLVIYWSKALATPLCGASDRSRSMGQSSASGDFEGPSLSPCRTVLRLVLETLLEPRKMKVCTFCLRRETLPAVATCLFFGERERQMTQSVRVLSQPKLARVVIKQPRREWVPHRLCGTTCRTQMGPPGMQRKPRRTLSPASVSTGVPTPTRLTTSWLEELRVL